MLEGHRRWQLTSEPLAEPLDDFSLRDRAEVADDVRPARDIRI
jgi:hypothetical protein